MKKLSIGVVGLLVTMFIGVQISGAAPTSHAPIVVGEGIEAVGIIVKNGTKMDTLLAENFVRTNVPCDPDAEATTTPQMMCPIVTFEGREVEVFYTADDNMATKQQFFNKLGDFPFGGRIDYVNRAQQDIETRLIQFMLESGAGSYTIIREP